MRLSVKPSEIIRLTPEPPTSSRTRGRRGSTCCRRRAVRQRTQLLLLHLLESQFFKFTPSLVAFTGVTNAHGLSPQPTACRSLICSNQLQQEVTRPEAGLNLLGQSLRWMGCNQVPVTSPMFLCCPIKYEWQ